MKKLTILLILISSFVFGQDGHITYNDEGNVHFYGRTVLHRSDAANLDTLTSLYSGQVAFDTTANVLKYVNTSDVWTTLAAVGGSGNT